MTWLILLFGAIFGAALKYGRLNRFNTISGMATLEDFTVAKAIAIAVGVGAILLNIEIGLGWADYHIKPLILGGIMGGGLIFGAGMAILGYCPGTLAVSLGEGALDALVGIIGGLVAGVAYTLLVPSIGGILGPDLGKISFNSWFGNGLLFFVMLFAAGFLFIGIALWLHKFDKKKDLRWLYAGIAIALLNCIVFLHGTTDRVIGASGTYPYVGDLLTGLTQNDYYAKVEKSGHWELIFLAGAFGISLILSLINKSFSFRMIYSRWEKYKGPSQSKRIIWAFIGGFLLIFGARMAGGCTSGHVISGGMQLSIGSLVFAIFVFAGLLLTGWLFYSTSGSKKE